MAGNPLIHYEIVDFKILTHDKVTNPVRKQRFMQEANAASALRHPNIIVQIADGLGKAHTAGIIHHGLEPASSWLRMTAWSRNPLCMQ